QVDYWDEMCRIMDWTKTHATTTMYICWASLAGLYYLYGIDKHLLPGKMSGIFEYRNMMPSDPLMRGVDEIFRMPQSRYATVYPEDVAACPHLHVAAKAENGDMGIIVSDAGEIFITGHMEYDVNTLAYEFQRDIDRGMDPKVPVNYFPDDDPRYDPFLSWRSYSMLVFTNWLNYYVYQATPYDLRELNKNR
ncbi:MAG: homoserine O-succinyltransferase, partial [Candidatus Methanomethylophilaceae archaeon]|nr:homoserine O-succinyltransferase [Candidatus Methanomethylophilaceae archaeon]